jgi:hypothetical protein
MIIAIKMTINLPSQCCTFVNIDGRARRGHDLLKIPKPIHAPLTTELLLRYKIANKVNKDGIASNCP